MIDWLSVVFLMFFSLIEAFDNELMCKTLKDIVEGKVVDVPTYDFVSHSRYNCFSLQKKHPVFYLFFDLLSLRSQVGGTDHRLSSRCGPVWGDPRFLPLASAWNVPHEAVCGHRFRRPTVSQRYWSFIFFGSCQCSVNNSNWFFPKVLRDMSRGRDLEQILSQYTTFVKPAFEEFCLPVSIKVIWYLVIIFFFKP